MLELEQCLANVDYELQLLRASLLSLNNNFGQRGLKLYAPSFNVFLKVFYTGVPEKVLQNFATLEKNGLILSVPAQGEVNIEFKDSACVSLFLYLPFYNFRYWRTRKDM